MESYPHMCRDGHVQIGHADNSSEMCPLCRAIEDVRAAYFAAFDYLIEFMGCDGPTDDEREACFEQWRAARGRW